MKQKAAEILFLGIGAVDEDLLEEAQDTLFIKRHPVWKKWMAAAACIGIVFAGGATVLRGMFRCGSSGSAASGNLDADLSFGPVFSLSVLESDAQLTAVREMNFDFSPYCDPNSAQAQTGDRLGENCGQNAVMLTDRYTLTNTADTDQTVTLLYPFSGSFWDSADRMPKISVDGVPQQAKLLVDGKFASESKNEVPENVMFPSTWQEYGQLLRMGAIREHTALQQLDVPVIVYEITNRTEPINEQVRIELSIDADSEKTQLLSNRINGASTDDETGKTMLKFDEFMRLESQPGTKAQLIVLGDDIKEIQPAGKVLTKDDRWVSDDRVAWEIDRFETTLSQALASIVHACHLEYSKGNSPYGETILSEYADESVLLDALAENLWYHHVVCGIPYHVGMLQYERGETILYASLSVTIPANSSSDIIVSSLKQAGVQHGGGSQKEEIHRYDMLQMPDSALNFKEVSASVSNTQFISIVSQNFGFDPENGVTKVALDPGIEHYYMDVTQRNPENQR